MPPPITATRRGARVIRLNTRETAPLRPSGGRGRGPTRRVGRVRWPELRTGPPAPLTLPSPPGRRGERVKLRLREEAPFGTFHGRPHRRFEAIAAPSAIARSFLN